MTRAKNGAQPEYLKVRRHILALLADGRVQAHGRLPSERELCELTGVNRNTARHAMVLLEREGVIYRAGRRGWFASGRRLVHDLARQDVNFTRLVREQGMSPSWIILESGERAAGAELAELFEVAETTRLTYSFEVGLIDGRKVYYAEDFFLAAACPGILEQLADRPTTDVWREDYGVAQFATRIRIRPVGLHSRVSRQLGVPAGTPGLAMRKLKSRPGGPILWLNHAFWRFDAIELCDDDA